MSRILGTRRHPGGRRLRVVAIVFATVVSCVFSVAAQSNKATGSTKGGEEFFIVSSVDITKKQLLLKEPTEITQLIQVNDKTHYVEKNGKPMQFGDLRAGDTIYIKSANTSAGRVAVSIRKGPMTLQELQRHYLK
jgi:hypothetical protein